MKISKQLITTIILFSNVVLFGCSNEDSSDNSSKGSVIAKPQLDALEKAKKVEGELLKRKEQLDEEEVKY